MSEQSKENGKESQWISLSDLMSSLMMVFLFIAIAMMRSSVIEADEAKAQAKAAEEQKLKAEEQEKIAIEARKKVEQIVKAYQENQVAIYDALYSEFQQDLSRWDAEIDKSSLTVIFKSPDILFAQGDIALTPKFKQVLDEFFPRYLQVLTKKSVKTAQGDIKYFKDSISEVRIEGHTNSVWSKSVPEKEAYYLNMELSQGRTRSVLSYVYDLPSIEKDRPWVKSHIAAVGFSSSRPVYIEGSCPSHCTEDMAKSRRVSFRIITNADSEIQKILATFQ